MNPAILLLGSGVALAVILIALLFVSSGDVKHENLNKKVKEDIKKIKKQISE